MAASQRPDVTADELAALPAFTGRGARRHLRTWQDAVAAAHALPAGDLPATTAPLDGPPPPRSWGDRDPEAAARLAAVRAALAAVAEQVQMPPENVLAPDAVKRICWEGPTAEDVAARLAAFGARPWQVRLAADGVGAGLHARAAVDAPAGR